ncbi:MAG: hypothetical protein AABY14_03330, partial [Nanoarchaeota archaeon]
MKQVLEISSLERILNNLDKNSNFFNPSDSFPGWHAYLSPEIVGWTKKFAIHTTSETLGDKPLYILEHYRVNDATFVRVKIGDDPAFTQTPISSEYFEIMWNNNLKKLLQITTSVSSTKNDENNGILDKYDKFFILVHPFYLTFYSSAFGIRSERLSEYHHTLQRLFSEREDYGIIVYENPISYLAFSEKLHCNGI